MFKIIEKSVVEHCRTLWQEGVAGADNKLASIKHLRISVPPVIGPDGESRSGIGLKQAKEIVESDFDPVVCADRGWQVGETWDNVVTQILEAQKMQAKATLALVEFLRRMGEDDGA